MLPSPHLETFVPMLPFATGHTQTLLGHFMKSDKLMFSTENHVLDLPDGDQLLLKCYQGKKNITLSLYHGLGANSEADYMRRSANIAYKMGWNVILVNHRSASPLVIAQKTYHSGRGDDAEAVILWARKKFPSSLQVATGFSMSGAILLNLLTKRFGQEQPDVAVVVNAPLDLGRAADMLRQGFSKIYDFRFYLTLKKLVREKGEKDFLFPLLATTKDFDDIYTSIKNGFENGAHYYRECSPSKHVHNITTNTFVLTAKDDPFIHSQDYEKAPWSQKVNLTIAPSGGHLGYISRAKHPQYSRRWLDHYLSEVYQLIQR